MHSIPQLGTTWTAHMIHTLGAVAAPDSTRWYATYTAPSGERICGTMRKARTPHCWLFIPEDGSEPLFTAYSALEQHGQCDIADEQYAQDHVNGCAYTLLKDAR